MRRCYVYFCVLWGLACSESSDTTPPIWHDDAMLSVSVEETRVSLSWPAATDNQGIVGYRVYLDGSLTSELGSDEFTSTVENLAPAREYILAVTALDAAGNETITPLASSVKTLDVTPPTWPVGELMVTELTPTSMRLTWPESRDNVATVSYSVYVDDRRRADVDADSLTTVIDRLRPATEYHLRIEARDAVGNRTIDGPSTRVTTPDQTAPSWIDGAQLSVASMSDTSIDFAWEPAIDDVAVTAYEISRAADILAVLPGDTFSYRAEGLAVDTEYAFALVAIDDADNRSAPLQVNVQTSDSDGPTWSADAALTVTSVTETSIQLAWDPARDDGSLAQYVIGQDLAEIARLDASTTQFEVLNLMPDQEYIFDLAATDRVGNLSSRALRLVVRTLDTTAPTWPVGSALQIVRIGEESAQVRWPDALDNVRVSGYRVDLNGERVFEGDAVTNYVDLVALEPSTDYRVDVFARDRVGVWSDPLNSAFTTVDLTRPTWADEAGLTLEAISETDVDVQWPAATDNVGVDVYIISIDGEETARVAGDQVAYRVSGLEPWTEVGIKVDAQDASGHVTVDGLNGAVRTLDETAPNLSQEHPLSLGHVTATELLLSWGQATDNGRLSGYELRQDGALIFEGNARDRRLRVGGVQPGQQYEFTLVALDEAGLSSAAQTLRVSTPDGAAPFWPEAARVDAVERLGQDSIRLEWSAALDDVGVATYLVYHQNVLIERVPAPQRAVVVAGLNPERIHVFRIEAEDASGAVSINGPERALDLSDSVPPAFGVDAELRVVVNSARIATVQWPPATDDVAVAAYRIVLDGQRLRRVDADARTTQFNELEPNSNYRVEVVAEDAAGQSSMPLRVDFNTPDLDAPEWPEDAVVAILAIKPDQATLRWDSPMGETSLYQVTVVPPVLEAFETELTELTLTDLAPDSAYNVQVTAVGPTGRRSAAPLNTVLNTPEDVPPTWPEDASLTVSEVNETGATVAWPPIDAAQDIGNYVVMLDGDEFAVPASDRTQIRIDGLSLGESYQVTVLGENVRGLRSTDGLTVQFETRDVTPPSFPPDGELRFESPTVTTVGLSWPQAFDNVGVAGYLVYRDDELLVELNADIRAYRTVGMQPGSEAVFRVVAIDAAGVESTVRLTGTGGPRSGEDIPTDEAVRLGMSPHCAGCHETWFESNEAFSTSIVGGQSGDFAVERADLERNFIVPGDPENSLLIELLEGRGPDAYGFPMMPPIGFGAAGADFATLSEAGETEVTLLQVRDWIEVMGLAR